MGIVQMESMQKAEQKRKTTTRRNEWSMSNARKRRVRFLRILETNWPESVPAKERRKKGE